MRTVYGPVPSRRLGVSLGIDPVCSSKGNRICNFDCVYCQLHALGPTNYTVARKVFVPASDVEKDLVEALETASPDIITLSGTGEPTLAKNLGEIIKVARNISDVPMAILTNSSLMPDENVRRDLRLLDNVIAKLDVPDFETFKKINRPADGIRLGEIINSLRIFRQEYGGKLSMQMMFIDENKNLSKALAELAATIRPDEVQIDTPLRPSGVKPLPRHELEEIKHAFLDLGLKAVSIYDLKKPGAKPLSMQDTLLRRPEL
jgi:wyosine [tRNA(Phe)-imidazoG37] synthetase (radical SAM superfamily)